MPGTAATQISDAHGERRSRSRLMAEDAAFARALAAGDPEAAKRFVDRCLPTVLGVARRLLRDDAEAEDVAQETFVRVWRNASRWKPGAARFDTWVGRIAINLCYDRLRKRREQVIEDAPERRDASADQQGCMERGEAAGVVRAAMAKLPERQRLALELCHFLELSNVEAAAMMEVNVEALESLLARARRKLRADLALEQDGLLRSLAAVGQSDWI